MTAIFKFTCESYQPSEAISCLSCIQKSISAQSLERIIGCNVTSPSTNPLLCKVLQMGLFAAVLCMFRADKYGSLPEVFPRTTSVRRAVPALNKRLPAKICHCDCVVQSAECRTQNCPEEHTVKHPATHVLPLLFVFLAMRYEDALKSPKIDDRIFGKFGFILVGLSDCHRDKSARNQLPH